MTQAVNARRDGDAFQARIFWLKAAKLLEEDGAIIAVGFENGPKGFDDVFVEYGSNRGPMDQFGKPIDIDRMQCKWHVTAGWYTHLDLTSPDYINATSTSFLQRALAAYRADVKASRRSTVGLVTNHAPAQDDLLFELIRTKSWCLNVDKLFAGKTAASKSGSVRKAWADHLGLDESALRDLCVRLRLNRTYESLDHLRERVDEAFKYYGLIPIGVSRSASEYDDLAFQWAGQGRNRFDRKSFKEACLTEGLLATRKPNVRVYGVKSFEHAIDRLEDRCVETLNLVSQFDGRAILEPRDWLDKLNPDLRAFLTKAAQESGSDVRLSLDAHSTLAFAAGAVLDTKSGRRVEIEQRTPSRAVWAADDTAVDASWPRWQFETTDIDATRRGLAVAVSLSRDASVDVKAFIASSLPDVGRLLVAAPVGGTSQTGVRCGAHANLLAEELASQISTVRKSFGSPPVQVHLFIAAPNGFTFFLGRHAATMWPLTLYEFDFETTRSGSYEPSLQLP